MFRSESNLEIKENNAAMFAKQDLLLERVVYSSLSFGLVIAGNSW